MIMIGTKLDKDRSAAVDTISPATEISSGNLLFTTYGA